MARRKKIDPLLQRAISALIARRHAAGCALRIRNGYTVPHGIGAEIAAHLGVGRAQASLLLQGRDPLPEKHRPALQRIVDGAV